MRPVPAFPLHRLPPLVREAIQSIQSKTRAPTSLVASSVLSALSLAVQAAYDVERIDGLISPVAMNFLVIAASGDRKTTVDNIVMKPFHDFQKNQNGISRFIFSDITSFAFLTKLHESCRSAALIENEAGRIFDGRLMEDIGFLNKLWDGKSVSVDRHKKSFEIDSPRCTMSLMIQPKIFRAAMRRTGERLSDYGFLARCLICEPLTMKGQRFIHENNNTDNSGYENFCTKIRNLLADQVDFFSPGSEILQKSRKTIKLDYYARKQWISIYNEIEREMGPQGLYDDYPEYASKMAENIARLAAILHIFEDCAENAISEAALLSARDIILWYASEYMRLFSDDGSFDQIVEDARKLEKFLIKFFRERNLFFCKKNDLLHYGPYSLRTSLRLDAAICHLVERGVIVEFPDVKSNAAGRPSKTIMIALNGMTTPFSIAPQQNHIAASLAPPTNTFNPHFGH